MIKLGSQCQATSDKRHLLNMGKIHQSIGSGGNRVHGARLKRPGVLIYNNKVDGLAETNPKKWRNDIKSLRGQDTFGKREWYHQL